MNEELELEVGEELDELATLKQRADIMGIKYHPNIKLERLKAKVKDKLEGITDEQADEEVATIESANMAKPTAKETADKARVDRRHEALKLVRIRVACMNPIKANMKGEIFSVGNAELGMQKKFVPFNAEQGWHVPNIIFQEIKDKKFVSHYTVKIGNKTINKNKLIPEYSIEILDPLTVDELKDLANRQMMANKGE
jgi:hypothetical protein